MGEKPTVGDTRNISLQINQTSIPMKNTPFFLMLISVALSVALHTNAPAWSGKVIGVADGDTLKVQRGSEKIKIRLYGVDTPETKQPYGNIAKKVTNALVRGKMVEVQTVTSDRYGRTVGLVSVDGKSLNKHLVQKGYAWVYPQYCKKSFCNSWKSIEVSARMQERGMWKDPNIVPPWEYRHQKRSSKNSKASNVVDPYHGNVKSKTYHRESCKHYNCKNCTKGFKSKKAAITAGYHPCGGCNP